jgi:chlorobactene glucosyltransferase
MAEWLGPLTIATFWIVAPIVILWRLRDSRSLDDESPETSADAPLVSVIIPARNEAHNIGRCVGSVLSTDYANVEVIVVDDHSTDDTRGVALAAAPDDPRLRVITNPDLPEGWFGKPWACTTGAVAARGDLLCFADADTTHAPDLLPRVVRYQTRTDADMVSVIGHQEFGTFWERVVQPHVFTVLAGRYGGTEKVNRSTRVSSKIANGQFLLMRRDAYDAIGGHGAVRAEIAEDLAIAQRMFASGRKLRLVLGIRQLSTRMYTSLAELVRGWRKNVFAGGRAAMPGGRIGRLVFPLLLPGPPLLSLVPVFALLGAGVGLLEWTSVRWAAIAVGATLIWWLTVYRRIGLPAWYALTYPLGATVLLGILAQAIWRGERVEWKGRKYVAMLRPHEQ